MMEELGKEEQGPEPIRAQSNVVNRTLGHLSYRLAVKFTSLSHIVPLTMVHLSSLGSHRSLILSERNQTKQRRSEGE